jgi:hypothetical protein
MRDAPYSDVTPLGGAAKDAFFAQVRADVPPSGASVLSDASGRWFHAFCARCGWRGQAAKDKKLIQARADNHNRTEHP